MGNETFRRLCRMELALLIGFWSSFVGCVFKFSAEFLRFEYEEPITSAIVDLLKEAIILAK